MLPPRWSLSETAFARSLPPCVHRRLMWSLCFPTSKPIHQPAITFGRSSRSGIAHDGSWPLSFRRWCWCLVVVMLCGNGCTRSFIYQAGDDHNALTAGRHGSNRITDSHRLSGFGRNTIDLDMPCLTGLGSRRTRREQTDSPHPCIHSDTATGRRHNPSLKPTSNLSGCSRCVQSPVEL